MVENHLSFLYTYSTINCLCAYADEMNDTQKSSTPNASQGTVLPSVGSQSSDAAAVTVKDTKQVQDTSQHALDKPKYR